MATPSVFRESRDKENHHQFKSLRDIRKALAEGADPNEHNALHLAVKLEGRANKHAPDIIEELIRHGADVHSIDWRGRSPLHVSNHEHVDLLVRNGADVNAKDSKWRTPLFQETEHGMFIDLAKAELLLRYGANVNARDRNGGTALHNIKSNTQRHVDFAKLLLEHGADATLRNDIGHRPYATTGLEVIRAAESKQLILRELSTSWKPSDCKDDLGAEQQEERQTRQRKM